MHAGRKTAPPTPSAAPQEIGPDRVAHVRVGPDSAGQRLDNFLLRLAKGVPKSHIYRVVRSGEVRVNRLRVGVDHRLEEGDEVRVPPMRVAERPSSPPPAVALIPPVLFEDEHLMVVDKPAGLAAHGGSGVSHGLIERVRAGRPAQSFLELAHRLDRETSGALILAKTRRALVALHAAMREGRVDKRYFTLVAGAWPHERQHVRLALHKFVNKAGERRVSVDQEQGAPSHTIFNLLERLGGLSLLEAELKTGRTHQIRVHLAHLGYPIVGDDKYGDFELNRRAARGELGARLGRMFLHAHRLALAHPVNGSPLVVEAPLPADCDDFLRGLRRATPL
ncbi:MAG TPA: RluA family pseudouridine synthase [Burkholderiaceae bacterium]|nr:RluA family pseudouridine synthase [Burkholderiaceae bacterium]HRZ00816.1 RluA family pseudouridine synthase [Burkholderiaceae bacterium]